MRIALNAWFWDRLTTGSGQYTRRLVEALSAFDPELELWLVDAGPRRFGIAQRRFGDPEPAPAALPTQARGNLRKLWFEQVAFPIACRRLRADVAHVPYWAPPLIPTVPTIVTIHDLIPLLLPAYRGGLFVRAYTALVSQTARRADLVVTDSEASRRDIVRSLKVHVERVRVVHLAAGEAYVAGPADLDAATRARLSLPARYLLYLAGFDARKNVQSVLAAYRLVEPEIGDECPLVIAGQLPERDTPFAPDPRRLASELGIAAAHIRFLGWVAEADKPALYRGTLALIFLSRYEGFGLPPLEAMACGTPVIGSDAASMPEVVGAGGLLYDPDDVEGTAEALSRLASDEGLRARLSERALAQATRFSWQRTAGLTLAAYRDAISLHP